MRLLLILTFSISLPVYANILARIRISNVSSEKLRETNPNELEILEYIENKPPEVKINCLHKIQSCDIDGKPCSEVFQLKLKDGASSNQKMILDYQCNGEDREKIVLNLLGKRFPAFTVSGESSVNQNFVLSPENLEPRQNNPGEGEGHLLILSPKGKILFYRSMAFPVADFRIHHLRGKTYYSYLKVLDSNQIMTTDGYRFILNSNFEEIKKIPWLSDGHEFVMLDLNDFFIMDYTTQKDGFGVCYIDPVIRHIKNGKKIFELDSKYLLARGLIGGPNNRIDYRGQNCKQPLHTNSFQLVDENHLLVSTGYSFLLMDMRTRRIEWLFGGNDSQFNWNSKFLYFFAHTPFWDPKKRELSYFVNLFLGAEESSKFVKVRLDTKNKRIEDFSILADNFGTTIKMGSGQISKNGAITLGLGMKSESSYPDIMEFMNGTPTMTIRFSGEIQSSGYRAYRDE